MKTVKTVKTLKAIQTLRLLSLAGLGSLLAVTAAQAQSDRYFYGGAGVGHSRARISEEDVAAQLRANGVTQTSISVDETDTSFKVFAGYQLNRNFGVEAGYFRPGTFGSTSTTAPAGTFSKQFKIDGVNLDLVGSLPFADRWSASARVGGQYSNVRTESTSTGAVRIPNSSQSDNSFGFRYGVGLQYEINPSLFVRADADVNRIRYGSGERYNVRSYAVSLVFPFGRTVAAAPLVVAAPVYVAPPPAPVIVEAPVVVPVQTPPPPVYVAPPRPVKQDRN